MPAASRATRSVGPRQAVSVTSLGFGGGALGGMFTVVSAEEASEAVRFAYDSGIRYFDTAPLYGHGLSESRVGAGLAGLDRSTYVLSTKVGVRSEPRQGDADATELRYADPFLLDGQYDFSYDGVLRSLEGSFERLGVSYVDIDFVHDPDQGESLLPTSQRTGVDHFAATMDGAYRALERLRDEGTVKAIGAGMNGTEMLTRFARHGAFDIFLLAGRYTLLEQEGLSDLLPLCREKGISLVIGGVFNSGILAAGAGSKATFNYGSAPEDVVDRVLALEGACEAHGVPLAAAALRFPLGDPAVSAVIPGMRTRDEVAQNLSLFTADIPASLWSELRERNLIDAEALLPG